MFEYFNIFSFKLNLSPDGKDKDDDRKTTEKTVLLYSRIRPFPHPQRVACESGTCETASARFVKRSLLSNAYATRGIKKMLRSSLTKKQTKTKDA